MRQKKWYVMESQIVKGKYNQNKSTKFGTENIKSSLCDYSVALILVTQDTDVAFKIFAPFSACKTEIYDVFIDEANHIYIVMPM